MQYAVMFYRAGEPDILSPVAAYVVEAEGRAQAIERLVDMLGTFPFREFRHILHPLSRLVKLTADE